jgi:hypothetical protein
MDSVDTILWLLYGYASDAVAIDQVTGILLRGVWVEDSAEALGYSD